MSEEALITIAKINAYNIYWCKLLNSYGQGGSLRQGMVLYCCGSKPCGGLTGFI